MSESVLIKTEEMLKLLRISRKTLWLLVKNNKLPKPDRYGKSNVWYRESINRFLKKRMDESEANMIERDNPYRRKFKTRPSTI